MRAPLLHLCAGIVLMAPAPAVAQTARCAPTIEINRAADFVRAHLLAVDRATDPAYDPEPALDSLRQAWGLAADSATLSTTRMVRSRRRCQELARIVAADMRTPVAAVAAVQIGRLTVVLVPGRCNRHYVLAPDGQILIERMYWWLEDLGRGSGEAELKAACAKPPVHQ